MIEAMSNEPQSPMMFPDSVFISYDQLTKRNDVKYNVLCLFESSDIYRYCPHLYPHMNNLINFDPRVTKFVEENYDLILTWNEDLFSYFNNARKMLWGSSWVKNQEDKIINKKNKISFITSNKVMTPDHVVRYNIYNNLADRYGTHELILNDNFEYVCYMSPPKIENKIELLADSKFSICVENGQFNNYFTEKIIDAFLTKNIPLYRGCPNITDYFNPDGILTFTDIHSLNHRLKYSIKDGFYESRMYAIEENYELAKQYASPLENIKKIINRELFNL